MNHDFILNGADTDSIMWSKPSGESFSKEEQELLLKELNSLFPDGISWEHDGIYKKVIYFKAKNYVMETEDNKLKIKGSALKSSKLEKGLSEFQQEIIKALIGNASNEKLIDIYNNVVKEILYVKQIKRWSSKRTITSKILEGTRANETKVKDAIAGTEYKEADKIWVYFRNDNSLGLAENFNGDYNKKKLLAKLFKTSNVFSSVLPTKELFLNYALKKNLKLLEQL